MRERTTKQGADNRAAKIFICFLAAAAVLAGACSLLRFDRQRTIVFTLYTVDVDKDVMKMTAQLYPDRWKETEKVRLELKKDGEWETVQESEVINPGWTAHFRVEDWNSVWDVPYRACYKGDCWEGLVRKDPLHKKEIMVAAFTGNGPRPHVPKTDIVKNLEKYDPDLLVFTGDQVYRHYGHLQKWIEFGEDFGELIKDRPTICMPDDHDVGQGNLWGAGGRPTDDIYEGGYKKDAAYVKEVERAQTSHLPDPYDPEPVKQGIGVYFTDFTWGGISFAVIEDRKWKSGCAGLVTPEMGPRADHVKTEDYDKDALDPPGLQLLGERQLEFLRQWSKDWKGAEMKAVISQTIFANVTTHHGPFEERIYADLDSNGWPRSGRERALREIRKGFAFMIAGDQHLASIVHHGIDEWNDSGYSFCVPSIANYYPRSWLPEEAGKNRRPGAPPYTGEFEDGLGNKVTVYAVSNPEDTGREPSALHDKAPGFGIIRFDKTNRTITMECWPRQVDPTDPRNRDMQYGGWPMTIEQTDNYGRKAYGHLARFSVIGQEDPVVRVINEEKDEVVYTLRVNGGTFRPKVFEDGTYTVKIGEIPGEHRTFHGLRPATAENVIEVDLSVP